jgi:uncharacterized protein with HEPN domain
VKDPRVYLAHILECAQRIQSFTKDGEGAFFAQAIIQDAVIRNFEVIGEAAKRIPGSFRQEHPSIPWRNLASFRDVLIHNYDGVSLEKVWEVVTRDLPSVESAIRNLLPPLDQLERELNGE